MSWPSGETEEAKRIQALEQAVRQKDAQYSTLKNQLFKSEEDAKDLRNAVDEASWKLQQEATRATTAERELEKKTEETKAFKALKFNYESTIAQQASRLESRDKEVKQLEREIAGLSDDRASADDRLLRERNALQDKAKMLETELARARDQLRTAGPAAASSSSSSNEWRNKLQMLEQENAELRQNKTKRRRSSSFSGVASPSNDSEFQAVKSRLAKTQHELLIASNSWMALQKSSARDIEAAQSKVSDIEDDLARLRETLEEAESQNASLQGRISELDRQRASWEDQCSTLQHLAAVRADELESSAKQVDLLKTRESALVDEIAALEGAHATEIKDLQNERDQVAKTAKEVSEERDRLKEELSQLQQAAQRAELQSMVSQEAADAMKAERDRLLAENVEYEKLKVAAKALDESLQNARQDVANAEQRCRVVESDFETAATERDNFESEFLATKNKLQANEETMDQLRTVVEQLRAEMEELQATLDQSQEELSKAFEDCRGFQEELDHALAQNTALQQRLREVEDSREQSASQSHDDSYVRGLEAQLQTAKDSLKLARTQFADAKSEEEAAVQGLADNVDRIKALEDQVSSARGNITELEFKLREAQVELEATKEKLRQADEASGKDLFDRQARLEEKESKLASLKAQLALNLTRIEGLEVERDGLSVECTKLREEAAEHLHDFNDSLASPAQHLKSAAEADPLITRLRSERDAVEAQLQFLQAEQALLASTLQTKEEEFNEAVAAKDEVIHQLQAQLQRSPAATNSPSTRALQDQIQELRDQLDAVSAVSGTPSKPTYDAQIFLRERSEWQARVLRRNEQIGKLQAEIDQLKANLALAEDSISIFQSKGTDETIILDHVGVPDTEGEALLEQVENLDAQLAASEQSLQSLQEQVVAAESRNATLMAQIDSLEKSKQESIELAEKAEESWRSSQASLGKVEEQLATSLAQVEMLSSQAQQHVTDLESLSATRQEKKQLQTKLSEAREELLAAQATLQAHEGSVGQLQEVERQLEEVNGSFAASQQTITKLEAQLSQKQSELDDQSVALEDVQERVVQLEEELESLGRQLQDARSAAGQSQTQTDSLREQLAQGTEDQTEELTTLRRRLSESDTMLRAKDGQLDTFRKDLARMSKEISTLRQLVSQKDETATRLEATLNLTKTEADNLVSDFNMCSVELEKTESELEAQREVNKQQEEQIHSLAAEEQRLKDQLQELRDALEDAKARADEEEARNGDMEEQLRIKLEEVEETDERYLSSLKDIKKLQKAVERLTVRNEMLQRTVKSLEDLRAQSVNHQLAAVEQADGNAQPITPVSEATTSPPSSHGKKRPRDADRETRATSAPRAIVVPATTRPKAALPSPARKTALRVLSENKPKPLGQSRKLAPLKTNAVSDEDSTKGRGADQLLANLKALRQPRA